MTPPRRLIVGISGASGAVYGVRLLELLRGTDIETHLVVTRAADVTRGHELELSARELRALATVHHPVTDIGAAIASGSFRTMGMIVAPCSVRTLSEIATGATGNLLTRAADVVLKERKRLVLVPRETPLNLIHVRNFELLIQAGATILPANPSFYTRPQTVEQVADTVVARVLDHLGVEHKLVARWKEEAE